MNPFSTLKSFAAKVGEARRRSHTRRIVESLPENIRRDIGWPR